MGDVRRDDACPNAYLAPLPEAGELIEQAERALRLVALMASHHDRKTADAARQDAEVLRSLHKRWGKP